MTVMTHEEMKHGEIVIEDNFVPFPVRSSYQTSSGKYRDFHETVSFMGTRIGGILKDRSRMGTSFRVVLRCNPLVPFDDLPRFDSQEAARQEVRNSRGRIIDDLATDYTVLPERRKKNLN